MAKLYTLKEAMPKKRKHDSVKLRKQRNPGKQNPELLERCYQAHERLRQMRETRERVHRYAFVDQWADLIEYKCGKITEREYIKKKGNIPLQNNVMISIFNSVIGLYEKQGTEPMCIARKKDAQLLSDLMSATLQANWQDTSQSEILKAVFKDYLIGGFAMTRESYEEREEQYDTWNDYVNPNYAFFEGGSDPRHQDINLIGQLHECSREDIYNRFAREEYGLTINDLNRIFDMDIKDRYDNTSTNINDQQTLGNLNFYSPSNKNYFRVIEVWTKETRTRYQCTDPIATNANDARFRVELEDIGNIIAINKDRKRVYDQAGVPEEDRAYIRYHQFVDVFWYYTFMAPDGTVLCEGENPYEHKSHPYTIKLYPFVNGEVHPFLGTIIDQQRYINRLVVMHDMAARSAAKGITIIPKSCIPDDMTPEDFADQFTEYDGLIFYETSRLNPTARPEVITSSAVQIGTTELLQLQLNLTKEITNVSGALQGKTPTAGTSAQRYSMEMQNATTSLFSILNDMTAFAEAVAKKKVANIKQFYEDGRLIVNHDGTTLMEYDRMSVRDVMFNVSVKELGASAAYQKSIDETGQMLLQMGAIDVLTYLEASSVPGKDMYIAAIQRRQQLNDMLAQQQQQLAAQQQQMSPEQLQQSNQNVQNAQQMLQVA